MKINEVLNLYNLVTDPSQLAGHAELSDPGKFVPAKYIKIPANGSFVKLELSNPKYVNKKGKTTFHNDTRHPNRSKILYTYVGDPAKFSWGNYPKTKEKFDKINKLLARRNLKLDKMWLTKVQTWPKSNRYIFIAGSETDPDFIWQKLQNIDVVNTNPRSPEKNWKFIGEYIGYAY